MSAPIPIEFNLDMRLTPQKVAVVPFDGPNAGSETLFKDIMADENLLSDVMAKLKQALPEEVYSQIEEMVESGNELPLAAIFSLESPLFSQDTTMLQNGFELDLSQITAFVNSVKKISENLPKPNGSAVDKALDSFGRNISEALSQISTKGEGLGKQIQELLAAARADITAADPSKLIMPTSSGVDGTVTQSTALGTAISGLAQPSNIQANSLVATPAPITSPMGGESWSQDMGDRIMWMVGKGVQAASIRINPPDLGPIQVQLSVKNDQASVQMVVQHGAVKDALDAAMPRLREMMNESNLQLVNVDVSHRDSTGQSSSSAMFTSDQREQLGQFLQDQELPAQVEEELVKYYLSTSLIDDYA